MYAKNVYVYFTKSANHGEVLHGSSQSTVSQTA